MPNPTPVQILGTNEINASSALTSLQLTPPSPFDARQAVQILLSSLVTLYAAYETANGALTTYTATVEKDNIDIDTQRQTFTFTIDMALVIGSADNEPTV